MKPTANNKTVYILLTRTDTLFSRFIANITGNEYTHAALSLDYELTQLYSFGRLYAYIPWIGCFKREETAAGVYKRFPDSPCALFELKVNELSYDAINARICEIARESSRYRYNVIGLFGNYINKPIRRERRYFCSEFVADTLIRGDALRLRRDPALIRPSDFMEMVEFKRIYSGTLESLDEYIKQNECDNFKLKEELNKPLYTAVFNILRSRFKRA
jgi:Orthopoxvirus protein of unknown function (DUF830).